MKDDNDYNIKWIKIDALQSLGDYLKDCHHDRVSIGNSSKILTLQPNLGDRRGPNKRLSVVSFEEQNNDLASKLIVNHKI